METKTTYTVQEIMDSKRLPLDKIKLVLKGLRITVNTPQDEVPAKIVEKFLSISGDIAAKTLPQASSDDIPAEIQMPETLKLSDVKTIASMHGVSQAMVKNLASALRDKTRIAAIQIGYFQEKEAIALESLGATLARTEDYRQKTQSIHEKERAITQDIIDLSGISDLLGIDFTSLENAQMQIELKNQQEKEDWNANFTNPLDLLKQAVATLQS